MPPPNVPVDCGAHALGVPARLARSLRSARFSSHRPWVPKPIPPPRKVSSMFSLSVDYSTSAGCLIPRIPERGRGTPPFVPRQGRGRRRVRNPAASASVRHVNSPPLTGPGPCPRPSVVFLPIPNPRACPSPSIATSPNPFIPNSFVPDHPHRRPSAGRTGRPSPLRCRTDHTSRTRCCRTCTAGTATGLAARR